FFVAGVFLLLCVVFAIDSWARFACGFPPNLDTQVSLGAGRIWLEWAGRRTRTGGWAGQTNRFGLRYNRYSDDSGNLSVPSWYLAPPMLAGAMLCIWRARRVGRR